MKKILAFGLLAALFFSCSLAIASDLLQTQMGLSPLLRTKAPVTGILVKNTYPHQALDFTQGLLLHRGFLYESTGHYGQSRLIKKELATGKTLREISLPQNYFGEGIALLDDKIYQLTWKNEILIVYDVNAFQEIAKFRYRGEGWGLTSDGKHLLMSNGSSVISFHEPHDFKIVRKITVQDGPKPIGQLNELEYIQGEIWANIYLQDLLVRISPQNGQVLGWIDLSALRTCLPQRARVDVLNGIAWDEKTGRIFVTGKYWPQVFEIQLKK